MSAAMWVGVAIALLAGIVGVPLALGAFRDREPDAKKRSGPTSPD
jgi:hypothetical protein